MTKKEIGFEESLLRLEEIVKKLDSGSETLENSLKLYEEGISLVRDCTKRLETAEQKVKMLQITSEGSAVLTDFPTEEADS